jgi:radical S-adenosyl methionine domain-containing protein 2
MQKLNGGFADISKARDILGKLKSIGMEKVNFVGGEPMLYPVIFDTTEIAKEMGFVVSIVTNGYYLNEQSITRLAPHVDWIGLSIDSNSEKIEKKLGRGYGNHVKHVCEISDIIHDRGIGLKINTTVTRCTYKEDMRPLISRLNPDRWKVFQMLSIKGQNDQYAEKLSITDIEFEQFISVNQEIKLNGGEKPVFEHSEDMIDSYFMLSPSGNIIRNAGGVYTEYPLQHLEMREIGSIISAEKYVARGGSYDYDIKNRPPRLGQHLPSGS